MSPAASQPARSLPSALLPSPRQELLLRACLLRDSRAAEAWRSWKAGADIGRLDPASFRLLPLLQSNPHALGIDDPLRGRLRGLRRMTWTRNQVLQRKAASLLALFGQRDIPTLVLKGLPLILLHYRDAGLRPMNDIDILVPESRIGAAQSALTEAGWSPIDGAGLKATSLRLSVRHARCFRDASGDEVDLHWRALMDDYGAGPDDEFRRGAVPVEVCGTPTLALNPADQLLHVCAHGLKPNPLPSCRWVADAAAVLRSSGAGMDWERLVSLAVAKRMNLRIRLALEYLATAFEAPIPPMALERLREAPVSRSQAAVYEAENLPAGRLGSLSWHWALFSRYREAAGRSNAVAAKLLPFLLFLKENRQDRHFGQTLGWAVSNSRRAAMLLLKAPLPVGSAASRPSTTRKD